MTAIKLAGDLRACLQAYGQSLPQGRQAAVGRKPMAEFVGVTEDTIYRWLSGSQQPIGLSLIKTWHWLESQGYIVDVLRQIKAIDALVYDAGRYLAYGKGDLQTLTACLGYHKLSSTLAVLRAEVGMSADKRTMLQKWLRDIEGVPFPGTPEFTRSYDDASESANVPLSNQTVQACIVNLVSALLPLAQIALSDVFSDEERRDLRKASPSDAVYRLSRILSGLCSRESRRIVLQEEERK